MTAWPEGAVDRPLQRERADEVARAIMGAARTGGPGDGIVAVLPVEAVYHVRTGELATLADVGGSRGSRIGRRRKQEASND